MATLFGTQTSSYKVALVWATLTTILGSIAALFLAKTLLTNFTGKGLVPDDVLSLSSFSNWRSASKIFLARSMTLPLAGVLGYVLFSLLRGIQ